MKYLIAIIFSLLTIMLAAGCAGPAGKDGSMGSPGVPGTPGSPGSPGDGGSNGSNGDSGYNSLISIASEAEDCSNGGITILAGLDHDRSGTLDANEVSQSASVCNGENGSDGQGGATSFTPVAILDPCGTAPGVYNEVLLKLQNGSVLASFTDGGGTRFGLLSPGSYVTTDGDGCYFTLNNQGFLTDEHH